MSTEEVVAIVMLVLLGILTICGLVTPVVLSYRYIRHRPIRTRFVIFTIVTFTLTLALLTLHVFMLRQRDSGGISVTGISTTSRPVNELIADTVAAGDDAFLARDYAEATARYGHALRVIAAVESGFPEDRDRYRAAHIELDVKAHLARLGMAKERRGLTSR